MSNNAIIVVGTGRYLLLALRLISKINLVYKDIDSKITFHLFSDTSPNLNFNNVVFHQVRAMDWTNSALYKFEAAKKVIEFNYDNIVYIDADTNIRDNINLYFSDIFPSSLFALEHPDKITNHFEERQESSAFINPDIRKIYYQSCFYGGSLRMFEDLINDGKERMEKDIQNNILAKAEDESYVQPFLNKLNATPIHLFDKFIISDKGLGDSKIYLWGKFANLNEEWPNKQYYKMLKNAQSASNNKVDWDIAGTTIIYKKKN